MMTIERSGPARPTSPVHLHVDDTTPVHVHVKKPKKHVTHSENKPTADLKTRTAGLHGSSNLRRSTATAKTRSKSPTGLWVPPPGKTSKGSKLMWQGPQHRLEINGGFEGSGPERSQSALRMSDLSTDDEERVHSHMRQYEKKIDSLMSEVGTLKNEVELQKTLRDMEKKDELLTDSIRKAEEKDKKIKEYEQELEATEIENRILRQNVDTTDPRVASDHRRAIEEREELMKKLVEVELDGQAAAKQVSALRDAMRRLKEERKLSSTDAAMLSKQKQLLMERISDFEATNRTLRHMLREQHERQACDVRLTEQRDVLLSKLTQTEDSVQKLNAKLREKDRQISDLRLRIDTQQEENVAISGLQTSLENTRGHLQKQLRQKEGDCNRMAVQIRTIESQLAQEKIEKDHLQELLAAKDAKADRDKEALKKATRVQKQRASRSEDAVEQLNAQLLEKDTQMAELSTQLTDLHAHYDKLSKEKAQVITENTTLKTRVSELERIMQTTDESCKADVEQATARLHQKTTEASSLSLENERIKTSLATIEDKLVQSESEVTHLRANLRQYEALVEEYRSQMNKSRREADETIVELEEQKRESSRVKRDGQLELDKVKLKLEQRLCELETLPEMLRTTELKLQDAQERMEHHEKRNAEYSKLVAELNAKIDIQSSDIDRMRERMHSSGDESRTVCSKLEALEKKLHEVEDQNRDLLLSIAKKEEAIHQSNLRLDDKTRENTSLSRQLESALMDNKKQLDHARDKASCRERSAQSRLLDLESQLSHTKAEVARIQREKDECERRFNSRLYDLKDRLEQSQSTNRSMQNYVSFLKNSYSNVFGETGVLPTSVPGVNPLRTNFNL